MSTVFRRLDERNRIVHRGDSVRRRARAIIVNLATSADGFIAELMAVSIG